jgi:predicted branched-subunit amino acid permease
VEEVDDRRSALLAGSRAVWPLLVGVFPFGIVFGATTVESGFSVLDASLSSLLVLAGAAQIAAVDLSGDGASLAVAAGTALIINLRMLLYSASLAPWLPHVPFGRRVAAAYLLTDQAYAVSVNRYDAGLAVGHRFAYYLGAGWTLWLCWQPATVVGAVVGDTIPDSIPIDLAVELVFLVLLIPAIRDRPNLLAAATAGTIAVVGAELPANSGMFLAAIGGIVVGTVASLRSTSRVDAGGDDGADGLNGAA